MLSVLSNCSVYYLKQNKTKFGRMRLTTSCSLEKCNAPRAPAVHIRCSAHVSKIGKGKSVCTAQKAAEAVARRELPIVGMFSTTPRFNKNMRPIRFVYIYIFFVFFADVAFQTSSQPCPNNFMSAVGTALASIRPHNAWLSKTSVVETRLFVVGPVWHGRIVNLIVVLVSCRLHVGSSPTPVSDSGPVGSRSSPVLEMCDIHEQIQGNKSTTLRDT